MKNSEHQWIDKKLYPFESNYIQLNAGLMHYVDEGQGEIILFVHGTPTWSFLYRDFIQHFSKTHRCIAIDHLGFGCSEKPIDLDGSAEAHSKNLSEFVQKLSLKNVHLVVHDFGGPIGLGTAIENRQNIRSVTVFNTWLWATKHEPAAQKIDKVINGWLGKFLYLNMNFSPKVLLKKGFANKRLLSSKVHKHYIQPFDKKTARWSLLKLAKSLVGSSDWYEAQWQQLSTLEDKPWQFIWGMQDDFITTKYLEKWRKRLPNAQVHALECGHFVQEEKGGEAIEFLEEFLKKLNA